MEPMTAYGSTFLLVDGDANNSRVRNHCNGYFVFFILYFEAMLISMRLFGVFFYDCSSCFYKSNYTKIILCILASKIFKNH
jgi:hypothetical protein